MKKRVHEIAKERGLTSKEVIAALTAAGVEVKAAASSVDEDVAAKALAASNGGDGASASPTASSDGDAKPAAAPKPVRPVRQQGGGSPGATGQRRRRRVVIDSQASRRDHQPPPPPSRPPRRRGGRRRRPLLEEPVDRGPVEPVEQQIVNVSSGATVREVAETLGAGGADGIKKLMGLG